MKIDGRAWRLGLPAFVIVSAVRVGVGCVAALVGALIILFFSGQGVSLFRSTVCRHRLIAFRA
uniref:Uncharacterized protein n=1 Tax=Arundo donax TaxID=35708 RepID=A0A0A9GD98_ARUDO